LQKRIAEQKAEIASYERSILEWDDKLTRVIEGLPLKFNSLKTEAIKEFAERLKEEFHVDTQRYNENINSFIRILTSTIDVLVKEMVGEQE